jgi:hypothetical protein
VIAYDEEEEVRDYVAHLLYMMAALRLVKQLGLLRQLRWSDEAAHRLCAKHL